jgi:hypothetical protein
MIYDAETLSRPTRNSRSSARAHVLKPQRCSVQPSSSVLMARRPVNVIAIASAYCSGTRERQPMVDKYAKRED